MFKLWLRLLGLLFGAAALVLVMTLLIGPLIPTEVVIAYRRQASIEYPMFIRDRSFTLWLAGTRCYLPVPAEPEWNATRHQYESNYYPEAFQIHELLPDAAVKRVHC